jgi:hypothetical protein
MWRRDEPKPPTWRLAISEGQKGNAHGAKRYRVSHPALGEVEIYNLKEFCETNHLPYQRMSRAQRIGKPLGDFHIVKLD